MRAVRVVIVTLAIVGALAEVVHGIWVATWGRGDVDSYRSQAAEVDPRWFAPIDGGLK